MYFRHTDGPYIISTLEPIDELKADNLVYINQDLSQVPLNVLPDHINAFIEKASGPVSVTRRNVRGFMLALRTKIAQIAGPADNVLATISLVHSEPKEKK